MSVPATNALPARAAQHHHAHVVVGVDALAAPPRAPSYIAKVIALRASGRLNVTHAAGPLTS